MHKPPVLGIDIGGTGVKGALVDLTSGRLVTERVRIPTPEVSTPTNIADTVAQIVEVLCPDDPDSPVGITMPAIVSHGRTLSAANIDPSWVDAPAQDIFEQRLGRRVRLVNDADAAGIAEVKYGAAQGQDGLVILTTLGTGIGSALIYNGMLIPNAELGHLEIDGFDAEKRAASSVKEREGLKWSEYIPRLQRYYETLEALFSPDLFVVGGGISRKGHKFLPQLKLRAPIVPAALLNAAGLVGAAWIADQG